MADERQIGMVPADDPEQQATVVDAQETLPEFRALLRLPGEANALVAIKARVAAGPAAALLWLMVIQPTRGGFVVSAIEVPPELAGGLAIGDRREVPSAEVLDWMYNMDGILHGGFSLRLQRSRLDPDQHAGFDERIGVRQYA